MAFRKELVQIYGRVFGSILEAQRDLRVAERRRGAGAVDAATFAQGLLDVLTEFAAGALEIAGNAGFVLAQFAADLRQGLLRGVVQTQALLVARVEKTESDFQGAVEEGYEFGSMRIPERLRTGAAYVARCGKLCRGQRGVAVRAVEIGEATARADGVDVPLSEDRASP